jgi:hypothetical protein
MNILKFEFLAVIKLPKISRTTAPVVPRSRSTSNNASTLILVNSFNGFTHPPFFILDLGEMGAKMLPYMAWIDLVGLSGFSVILSFTDLHLSHHKYHLATTTSPGI